MSKLEDLLKDTNDNVVKGWAFRVVGDPDEGFKLLKLGAIETEDGTEDEWVATIHSMDSFMQFITEEATNKGEL